MTLTSDRRTRKDSTCSRTDRGAERRTRAEVAAELAASRPACAASCTSKAITTRPSALCVLHDRRQQRGVHVVGLRVRAVQRGDERPRDRDRRRRAADAAVPATRQPNRNRAAPRRHRDRRARPRRATPRRDRARPQLPEYRASTKTGRCECCAIMSRTRARAPSTTVRRSRQHHTDARHDRAGRVVLPLRELARRAVRTSARSSVRDMPASSITLRDDLGHRRDRRAPNRPRSRSRRPGSCRACTIGVQRSGRRGSSSNRATLRAIRRPCASRRRSRRRTSRLARDRSRLARYAATSAFDSNLIDRHGASPCAVAMPMTRPNEHFVTVHVVRFAVSERAAVRPTPAAGSIRVHTGAAHDELVAADPHAQVAFTHRDAQTPRDLHEQLVAGGCPSMSFTRLKPSRSMNSSATGLPLAAGVRERRSQLLDEQRAASQTGEASWVASYSRRSSSRLRSVMSSMVPR